MTYSGESRAEQVLTCDIWRTEECVSQEAYTEKKRNTKPNFVFMSKEEKKKGIFEVQDRTYIPKSCQDIRRREKERGGSEEFSQSVCFPVLALTLPEL